MTPPITRCAQLIVTTSGFDPLLRYVWLHSRFYVVHDFPRVLLGLQESRHVILHEALACCSIAWTRERIKAEIVILNPPTLLTSLPGKCHEPRPCRSVYTVACPEIPDIRKALATCTSLYPTDFGRGPQKVFCNILDGKAALVTQLTKLSTEFALAYARTCCVCHDSASLSRLVARRFQVWLADPVRMFLCEVPETIHLQHVAVTPHAQAPVTKLLSRVAPARASSGSAAHDRRQRRALATARTA